MITKSAKKAHRQNLKRRTANKEKNRKIKEAIKAYKKLISARKKEEARKELSKVYKALDKAAKTNLIKKNRASRLKSKLTALLSKA